MAIYFGSTGFIELKRDALNSDLATSLDPADVNTTKKRFSVDNAAGSLITGDQIEIETVDKTNLELLSEHSFPDLRKYIHIDDMGGIKLYDTFAAALAGEVSGALTLTAPSSKKDILIRTRNTRFRPLAKITEFEITTTRDTVDVTNLGEEFRQQYENGLISGQGTIQTIWQHRNFQLDTEDFASPEFPVYLSQLLVRMQQGSDFEGRFYVYHDPSQSTNSVWYQSNCVVTNVAVSVPAVGIVEARIEFVTNGEIRLHNGVPPSFLLLESSDKILQEDGDGILLEDP
tara:strand:+ start:4393 stop:5253 length:861 start_codon:yes stop_codon:yes gene_type:complete